MANFDLNKFYKKSSDIKSPVDSRIQINKAQTDRQIWGDILLDLDFKQIKQRPLNAKQSTLDIKRIINEESVITSLRNIFNTYSCSRMLNPEMSFQLKQYLFEPLTQTKAWFLGYDICTKLTMYQPRVKISGVSVSANPDEACYVLRLSILIPQINKNVSLKSILKQDGFTILG